MERRLYHDDKVKRKLKIILAVLKEASQGEVFLNEPEIGSMRISR